VVRVEQGADFRTRWRFQATLDGRLPTTPVCGGSGARKVCEWIYLCPAGAGEDRALPGVAAAPTAKLLAAATAGAAPAGPSSKRKVIRIVHDPDASPVAKGNLCAQAHAFNLHAATKVAANDQ